MARRVLFKKSMAITLRLLAHLSKEIDRGNGTQALEWAQRYIPISDPLYRALLYRSQEQMTSRTRVKLEENKQHKSRYRTDFRLASGKREKRARRSYQAQRRRFRHSFLSPEGRRPHAITLPPTI